MAVPYFCTMWHPTYCMLKAFNSSLRHRLVCVQTAWLCTDYYLEQGAVQIEHRMPITQYKSYLVELAVRHCKPEPVKPVCSDLTARLV